jgi:hypothetical protein
VAGQVLGEGCMKLAHPTTVFPRQGSYAHDPRAIRAFPAADVTIDCIGDLLDCEPARLRAASRPPVSNLEAAP